MSTPDIDRPERRQLPKDLVAGVVTLGIAAVFRLNAGEGRLDWLFPVALSYALGGLGLLLVIRGLAGFGDRVAAVPLRLRERGDPRQQMTRGPSFDVAVFVVITVAYVALLSTVGFWVMSVLTIFSAAVYLDSERSIRRLALAFAVAVAVCLAGFWLMTRVFYVPFPPADWLPFL